MAKLNKSATGTRHQQQEAVAGASSGADGLKVPVGTPASPQVASELTDAKLPMTQAIVGLGNDLIASVCAVDGNQPGAVCSNAGVEKAAKAMGIS